MPKSCYDKALELLARRSHSRFELQRKLAARKYSSLEVETALARVTELGYLDDTQFAREFIRQKLGRGPVGSRRLQAELSRRGVSAEDMAPALEELLPQDDRQGAREAAERWCRQRPRGERTALARFLERQGFSRRAIFAALKDADLGGEAMSES